MLRQFAIPAILSFLCVAPSWAGKTYTREEAVNTALENSSVQPLRVFSASTMSKRAPT